MCDFKDVLSESGLSDLNSFLATRSYLEGYAPSQRDATLVLVLGSFVDKHKFPHVARWHNHILSFAPKERTTWPKTEEDTFFLKQSCEEDDLFLKDEDEDD